MKQNTNWAWIGLAIAVAAIVAVYATYRAPMPVQASSTTPLSAATDSATTVPNGVVPGNPQNQASPQGPTGPLNTRSGGAPAANPRGETAPGMQSGPGANN
jgi:hypothetical protein